MNPQVADVRISLNFVVHDDQPQPHDIVVKVGARRYVSSVNHAWRAFPPVGTVIAPSCMKGLRALCLLLLDYRYTGAASLSGGKASPAKTLYAALDLPFRWIEAIFRDALAPDGANLNANTLFYHRLQRPKGRGRIYEVGIKPQLLPRKNVDISIKGEGKRLKPAAVERIRTTLFSGRPIKDGSVVADSPSPYSDAEKTRVWKVPGSLEVLAAFRVLENEAEQKLFFRDILKEGEICELAMRWNIATMLNRGDNMSTIQAEYDYPERAIERVAKWLKHGCDGYKLVFEKLKAARSKAI